MAIIVEEEKKSSNASVFLGWFILAAIILAAAYYIFFAAVPEVITPPPGNFENITAITQVNFNPASVLSSTAFQALQPYIPEPTSTGPVPVGKPNPFIP